MPVEEHETTVERTKVTKRYICEECDEYAESWDPKNDPDIIYGSLAHSMNYVSLNPYAEAGREIGDEIGVYLCDDHIHLAGKYLDRGDRDE